MAETQDEIFERGEADRWFERNREALSRVTPEADPIMNALAKLGAKPKTALEIGACNGYRLAFMQKLFGTKCVAVEPSQEAIADGKKLYPGIEFRKGLTHALPLKKGEKFDLVVANFVFHWIDRQELMRSFAEVGRAVADGGLLAISDFFPGKPTRVRYHHLEKEEVWTYKQDYSAPFVGSNLYRKALEEKGSASAMEFGPAKDDYDRFAVIVLQKRLQGNYHEWKDGGGKA